MPETTTLEVVIQGKDQFTATANKVSGSLKNLERTAGAVGGHLASGLGSAVANLTKLGVLAGGFLVTQMKFGIDALEELERANAATVAGLKSTHGASGQTLASIRELAQGFEDLNATIDDKVIQSAENLLLTFPKVGKDAFKPTLQAALDLNTALGGGEGGLQGTLIQVAKAMQDPVRGLLALRRVGVSFTPEQEAQIKRLVKQNDLMGAQKIILGELSTEFGGRFAAAGKTSTAAFASLGDAVEELQMSLSEALLPSLVDIARELARTFKDPKTVESVKGFGRGLADAFKAALSWAKQVPWGAIGSGLKTAAGFAKGLVDAFANAPDWLKTAVITGWGLNKLTGGAVTNIFGDIAKGIGGQLLSRGSSAANPLWVQSVGGLPGTPGGGPGGLGIASIVATVAATLGLQQIANSTIPNGANPYKLPTQPSGFGPNLLDINAIAAAKRAAEAAAAVAAAEPTGIGPAGNGAASRGGFISHAIDTLKTALQANADAVRENSIRLGAVDATWAESLGKGVHSRSVAKYGGSGLGASAERATYNRDILRRADGIVKGSQDQNTKLARLQGLLKDAKNATDATKRKLSSDIKTLSAAIKKQPILITVNANTNVNLNGRKIAQANASTNAYGKYQTGQVL